MKKKTMIKEVYKFTDVIYGGKFYLYLGDYYNKVNFLKKEFNITQEVLNPKCTAENLSLETDDGEFINLIWMSGFKLDSVGHYSAFSHELLHSIIEILNLVGVKFNVDNQEAFNYYFQYVFEGLLNQIK